MQTSIKAQVQKIIENAIKAGNRINVRTFQLNTAAGAQAQNAGSLGCATGRYFLIDETLWSQVSARLKILCGMETGQVEHEQTGVFYITHEGTEYRVKANWKPWLRETMTLWIEKEPATPSKTKCIAARLSKLATWEVAGATALGGLALAALIFGLWRSAKKLV